MNTVVIRRQVAWIRGVMLVLWLGLAGAVWAQSLLPVPPLSERVIDTTGTLDASQKSKLTETLAALERDKGAQVVVLMVPTTAPEDIFSYANRVGNTWKIGRKNVGDGLIVLVAKDDRRMRIEVAKTLEGAVPDIAAKRILDEAMTPHFRAGDYAAGLQAAIGQIDALVRGEPLPPVAGAHSQGSSGGLDMVDAIILLFVLMPVGSALTRQMLGRKPGAMVSAGIAGGLAYILTASLLFALVAGVFAIFYALGAVSSGVLPRSRGGRRGGPWDGGGFGGGGFGSSGGFSSGGGGNFGGGGASGSW